MNSFGILLRMELRRSLTPAAYATPFLLLILSVMFAAIEARASQSFNVLRYFINIVGGFSLALIPPLLGGGMLALDVKDHWARTTLMRPVTRSHFVLARIGSVFILTTIALIINAWIPLPLAGLISGKPIDLNLASSIPGFFLLVCQAYVIIVLMTVLSCWLPGIMNVVLLGMWAIFSSLVDSYVRARQWDSGVLTVLKEFLFPSGFLEGLRALTVGGYEFWSAVVWGIAAAAGFTAFALWAFNRVTIETGSE